MNCVKTGCGIILPQTGQYIWGDLFELGTVAILNWSLGQDMYGANKTNAHYAPDLWLTVNDLEGCWHKEDKGVTVIPKILLSEGAWKRIVKLGLPPHERDSTRLGGETTALKL